MKFITLVSNGDNNCRSICFYMYSGKFKNLSLEILDDLENLAIKMMQNMRKLAALVLFGQS